MSRAMHWLKNKSPFTMATPMSGIWAPATGLLWINGRSTKCFKATYLGSLKTVLGQQLCHLTSTMPTSPAEAYLSAIAPPAELPPCSNGFEHSFKVCMGSKPRNAHEIGRWYSWVRGECWLEIQHSFNVCSATAGIGDAPLVTKDPF